MYLEKITRNGKTFLYKTEGVYDKITKKQKKVRITIGSLDKLKLIYDDPIEHFKNEIELENKQRELEHNKSYTFTFSKTKINYDNIRNNNNIFNLGCIYLEKIYYSLGLDKVINKMKYHEKASVKLEHILKLLIYNRIMNPKSKLNDFKLKDNYPINLKLELHDIYKALDVFFKYKDDFLSSIKDNISSLINYDLSKTHFDVTNFYLYTDEDNERDLPKKGYSKENVQNPIIQLGLLTDNNGIPIDYKLFSGNTPDVATYIDFINEVKKTHSIRKSIIIADAGLVSNDNIIKTILSGSGYIFKHSLLRLNKDDYNMFLSNIKPFIDEILEDNPNINGVYKSIHVEVDRTVIDIYGKKVKVPLTQKFLFTYSRSYDKRSKYIREEELVNADKYIKNPEKLNKYLSKVASSLINTKIKHNDVNINDKKLKKYEEISGYSLIISSEYDMDDLDILKAYKEQYRIEESFRVMKSIIKTRPIYLSNEDRIQSHFLICFLALLFIRILQIKLNRIYSVDEIVNGVKDLEIFKHTGSNMFEINGLSEIHKYLNNILDVDIPTYEYTGKELVNLFSKCKKI